MRAVLWWARPANDPLVQAGPYPGPEALSKIGLIRVRALEKVAQTLNIRWDRYQ